MLNNHHESNNLEQSGSVLSRVQSILNDIIHGTESEFIEIGQKLQGFYSSSKVIHSSSTKIADSFSTELLTKSNRQIEMMSEKINSYLVHFEEELKKSETVLATTLTILQQLDEDLSGYKRIIKHLKMLSISTRIESIRIFTENNSFEVIATNVEKLSGIVQEKTGVIKDSIKKLAQFIQQVNDKIKEFSQRENISTKDILSKIENCLTLLSDKYEVYASKIVLIKEDSSNIASNMNAVVSNIQFHDITRQQLEHVDTAFAELLEELDNNENDEQKIILLQRVGKLQIAQLHNSNRIFCGAVNDLIENLQAIGSNVESMFYNTLAIIGSEDASSIKFLLDLVRYMGEVDVELKKCNQISVELSESIKDVVNTSQYLSTFIYEIEEIGSEIELIAVNASIKAAHTGSEGAALGVIADTIQKISTQSKDQSEKTASLLKKIMEISESVQANIQSTLKDKLFTELRNIDTEVRAHLDEAKVYEQTVMKELATLQLKIKELSGALILTSNQISVHIKVSQGLDSATSMLQELLGDFDASMDDNNIEYIEKIKNKYTMQSERDIHNMFDVNQSNMFETTIMESSDDDNIELF